MIQSAAVLGAGTMGAQIAAHLANAGLPGAAARRHRRRGKGRARSRPQDQAGSVLPPGDRRADPHRLLRRRHRRGRQDRLDHRGGRREARRSSRRCSAGSPHTSAPASIVSTNTSGIPIHQVARGLRLVRQPHRGAVPRHALLQPAALPSARRDDSAPPTPIPRSSPRCAPFSTVASARASWSRTTGRDSSPIASAVTAWRARWNSSPTAASRSTKSMP